MQRTSTSFAGPFTPGIFSRLRPLLHLSARTRRPPCIVQLRPLLLLWIAIGLTFAAAALPASAQDRLRTLPGYEHYDSMRRASTNLWKSGAVSVTWTAGGKAIEFGKDAKRYRYDIAARSLTELSNKVASAAPPAPSPSAASTRARARTLPGERRERGRQFGSSTSPDGRWKAFYRDRNVWLSSTNSNDSTNAIAITTEGNERTRIKLGSASWVYGEELEQQTAIWWSPDSQRVAFYRFDESRVPDFFLSLNQTKLQSSLDVEAYPKTGGTNPIVDVLVYHLGTRGTVRMDVRDGKPFDNAAVGHYVYGVSWTQDGKELLFHRTNRRQNVMELAAADPVTGRCRVVVREEWPASWTENLPEMRFLKDGRRFMWASERTGWRNYYLYEVSGRLLATVTKHTFEVERIVRVDEDAGVLFYLARSGDNPLKLQLHRVKLDGTGDERLTDPGLSHQVDVAPDGRHFIDVAQSHDRPPVTELRDAQGALVTELARSDLDRFTKLGLRPVELFKFKAADGVTDLYGLLHFPSKFSRWHKYPLLLAVYAGPATAGAAETFIAPSQLTEFGFLVATLDARSANGRGKRSLDAIYQHMGLAEIDDLAAGVKFLGQRSYLDGRRVGIHGTSYGGTASLLCLLRYPDVFQAACASSAVTDLRNYDSIYTERYMWLPQENKGAYDRASAMTYVKDLRGRLMLFYGTADNNVHPNNTLQLVQALQREGKSFDLQVGPDKGHEGLNRDRMMEFFIDNLVVAKPRKQP